MRCTTPLLKKNTHTHTHSCVLALILCVSEPTTVLSLRQRCPRTSRAVTVKPWPSWSTSTANYWSVFSLCFAATHSLQAISPLIQLDRGSTRTLKRTELCICSLPKHSLFLCLCPFLHILYNVGTCEAACRYFFFNGKLSYL